MSIDEGVLARSRVDQANRDAASQVISGQKDLQSQVEIGATLCNRVLTLAKRCEAIFGNVLQRRAGSTP